jgi:hypothetical protein
VARSVRTQRARRTTHYSPVADLLHRFLNLLTLILLIAAGAWSPGCAPLERRVWEFAIYHETSRIREEIAALEFTSTNVLRVLPMALALQS